MVYWHKKKVRMLGGFPLQNWQTSNPAIRIAGERDREILVQSIIFPLLSNGFKPQFEFLKNHFKKLNLEKNMI